MSRHLRQITVACQLNPMHPHTYPFLFKNGDFYLQFGLPSTCIQWKQSPKTHLFKNTLQSRVFENAGFSFTCGQTKMEVSNMLMSYIIFILLAWCMLRKGWSRISIVSAFLCGRAKMIWICYVWMRIFWKGRIYPDACGWSHNRCIDHCKIFQDLVSQDTTLFPPYKFTLFAITHTSIPFLKPAVNPRMYFLIHGVK